MDFFLFIQSLITLFISGGIFFKEKGLKNRTLALYLLLFTVEILYFIIVTSGETKYSAYLIGRFYFSLGFIYGPLLWFHFKSIIDNKKQLIFKDLWHFLPLLLLNIYMLDIILMPNIERITYLNSLENFQNRIIYINMFRVLHQTIYAFLLVRIVWLSKNKVEVNKKFYLGGIAVIYIVTTTVITLLVLFANSWKDFSSYYVISILFVFIIGSVLFIDPTFFRTIKEKYQGSYLDENNMKLILSQIEHEFSINKIYLNNSLSLDVLSSKLEVKPHHISQTLSELMKENFNDYVNKHRIEYSKILLTSNTHANFKIEAIALDSGFNNKVTFYKAFSKFTNTTPSLYRKSL